MTDKPPGHRVVVQGKPASGVAKMGFKGPGGKPGNEPPKSGPYTGPKQVIE